MDLTWHLHARVRTHIHTYTHGQTYTHITYMHERKHARTYTHTYIHTYIHRQTYIHTCMYAHMHVHTCTHTYTHAYIHLPYRPTYSSSSYLLFSPFYSVHIRNGYFTSASHINLTGWQWLLGGAACLSGTSRLLMRAWLLAIFLWPRIQRRYTSGDW